MEQKIRNILHSNFSVPEDLNVGADLREYLEDSIDVGEFIAILNAELHLSLTIADFRGVHSIADIIDLIIKSNEA